MKPPDCATSNIGDSRCWSETLGAPNTPEASSPQPETLAVSSSEGLLHARLRNPGQADETRRSTFYFAGRPVAALDRTPAGAETWRWLTTDHLGTPALATSSAGLELWRGGFEPFGQDFNGASATGLDLRFLGQWEDETWLAASLGVGALTNLYRWYLPASGRYTRVDPVGIRGEEVNLYLYALSNPVLFFDSSGLAVATEGCLGAVESRVQIAAARADAASESCLPCELRGRFRQAIRSQGTKAEVVFVCVPWVQDPSDGKFKCGANPTGSREVWLTPAAVLGDLGCDSRPESRGNSSIHCLQATVLHEVLHVIGAGSEAQIQTLTKRCFSCAKNPDTPR